MPTVVAWYVRLIATVLGCTPRGTVGFRLVFWADLFFAGMCNMHRDFNTITTLRLKPLYMHVGHVQRCRLHALVFRLQVITTRFRAVIGASAG